MGQQLVKLAPVGQESQAPSPNVLQQQYQVSIRDDNERECWLVDAPPRTNLYFVQTHPGLNNVHPTHENIPKTSGNFGLYLMGSLRCIAPTTSTLAPPRRHRFHILHHVLSCAENENASRIMYCTILKLTTGTPKRGCCGRGWRTSKTFVRRRGACFPCGQATATPRRPWAPSARLPPPPPRLPTGSLSS